MESYKRPDLSDTLIHFTKGKTDNEAFENLVSILIEECIIASNSSKLINENVVCFTETPFNIICNHGFVNYTNFTNYRRFGLLFYKKDIYKYYDGRPVFYLEKKNIEIIPEEIKWRCTLFEPSFKYDKYNEKGIVDFSWEREWRIKNDFYFKDYEIEFKIIVPNNEFKNLLEERLRNYFEKKFDECYNEYPRYFYLKEYDYFEGDFVEIEVENEDNCECNRYDYDDKVYNIILIEK